MTRVFDAATLQTLDATPEIEIETSRGGNAAVHRVIIWIVVDGDSAFVRSVRGPTGRWYRELSANPHGAVHVAGQRLAVEAEPATEPATIARVSDLLRRKYQERWAGPTAAMLREEVLPTTIRLMPA